MSAARNGKNEETVTLSRFILEEFKGERQELSFVMNAISVACKIIAQAVQQAGVKQCDSFTAGIMRGDKHEDREYTQMDDLAGDVLLNALRYSQQVGLVAIDGTDKLVEFPSEPGSSPKRYAVVTDPLDGSANIDCNMTVGTTFGVYKSSSNAVTVKDILGTGNNLLIAGYVLYGAATVMMLTIGSGTGTHMFVVDPDYGEFVLAQRSIKIPDPPKQVYSINSGNSEIWDRATREFIRWTKVQETPYSARYVGSMVSDVHRTIFQGGIFMYPVDKSRPEGKLRLVSEIFPLSMLVEEAGGKASNGTVRCLDLVPKDMHEKGGVFLGCKRDVEKVETFYKHFGNKYEEDDGSPDDKRRKF